MEVKKKAFTILELICVIAIIALFVALLMPALSRSKDVATRVVCGSYMKAYGSIGSIYLDEHDGFFRVATTVGKTLEVLDGEKAAEVAGEFVDLVGAALENPNVSVEEQQEMVEDAIVNTFSKLTSNEAASDADLLGVKEEIAALVEAVVENAATLEVLES